MPAYEVGLFPEHGSSTGRMPLPMPSLTQIGDIRTKQLILRSL